MVTFERSSLPVSAKSKPNGYAVRKGFSKSQTNKVYKGIQGKNYSGLLTKDDDDLYELPPPTAKEVSDTIHGRDEMKENIYMNNFKKALSGFNTLQENHGAHSTAGFNRYLKYMSPVTRDLVLKSNMPDIMAFAEDRTLDPALIASIAEICMRLGRIPDLKEYNLHGDSAVAVADFMKTVVLNLAEDVQEKAQGTDESPKGKHLKLASDYKKLADFHKRRMKEEMDKGKIAKEDGRAHSSIRAMAASEEHKTLAAHCMGLADFHQLKANDHPASDATKPAVYPAQDSKKIPEEPPEDGVKEPKPGAAKSAPGKDLEPKVESTLQSVFNNFLRKTNAFPERPNSLMPEACGDMTRYGGDKKMLSGKKMSGQGYATSSPKDEKERPTDEIKVADEQKHTRFNNVFTLDEILQEAKKAKKAKKIKNTKSKMNYVFANAKIAPLFQALGRKMDHSEAKITGKKHVSKWEKDLYKKCLTAGASQASDLVLQKSIKEPWVREEGYTDESSNLRHNWETAMSGDAQHNATETSPTAPEPVVFTVNKMIKMSSK